MYHDLNVPWSSNQVELEQRVSFLAECKLLSKIVYVVNCKYLNGYDCLALTQTLTKSTSLDEIDLSFEKPSSIKKLLTRCNVVLDKDYSNAKIAELRKQYDIISVRPVDEKTLGIACQVLDTDIISFDLTIRYSFPFKFKMIGSALDRGIKFELCYGQGVLKEGDQRRNVMQNAASLIRSSRGRGMIISSEAQNALGCRAPHDIINLAVIWGLKQDVATESITSASRSTVAAAQLRKRSYRGAVDILSVPEGDPEAINERKRKKEEDKQQPKKQAKK